MSRTVIEVQEELARHNYVADTSLSTTLYLSLRLGKPLLIEGQAGVGKTEIAKVLAAICGTELIRLQCYEGLDAGSTLYEWNYPKQMLHIRMEEHGLRSIEQREAVIFSREFLLERPLLRAISAESSPPVLLIDEVDRADEEFEAFLLEVLSDFQVSIPELGTVRARHRPHVVLTSNRTRELTDALKRRCMYTWIGYPSFEKELEILRARVPQANERLAAEIAAFLQLIRRAAWAKTPGVAEMLDWALGLIALHAAHLEPVQVRATLGILLKDRDDLEKLGGVGLDELLSGLLASERLDEWSNQPLPKFLRNAV